MIPDTHKILLLTQSFDQKPVVFNNQVYGKLSIMFDKEVINNHFFAGNRKSTMYASVLSIITCANQKLIPNLSVAVKLFSSSSPVPDGFIKY
jgi:hypothetical protein